MKVSLLLCSALCAYAVKADSVKLMFGPPSTPDDQREFAGFRFVSADDPSFAKGKHSNMAGWTYNPRGGAAHGGGGANGSLPADTLLSHGIRTYAGDTLSVPFAKDGPVKVHVWVGDWFLGWRRMYGRDGEIWIRHGGKKVYEDLMTPDSCYKNWCKLEEYSYSKKDPIWDRGVGEGPQRGVPALPPCREACRCVVRPAPLRSRSWPSSSKTSSSGSRPSRAYGPLCGLYAGKNTSKYGIIYRKRGHLVPTGEQGDI